MNKVKLNADLAEITSTPPRHKHSHVKRPHLHKMNANQLKNILSSIKAEFGTETWDAALALLAPAAVTAEPAKKVTKKAAKKATVEGEKPKRVLTPEHKAAMQAGRVAKKAAKDSQEPRPVAEAPTVALVAEAPAVVLVAATEEIKVAGKTYIRLADGRCYEPGAIEGELGAWAGLFKNGVLDTTVSEN